MIEPSGFPSDTTQRERADAELLRQKTYLDELFELSPDAVVLTSLRGPRILRINREFTRIFGYTSEEAVGSCLRNLVMPDGLEPILPEHPDLLAGGKVEWEVIRRRKDGTRFHAHITGKRIQLSDDEDAAYLIFRDISARKQAEALFAGEKRLLEVIAAGGPLTTTLDALCRLAEDVDGSSLVSILLLDRNGKQLRHGAGPSLPPGYVDALDGAPVGLGIGPCAAAAHLGEQVISLDVGGDERWSDEIRALVSAHGLRACWSTPIKSSQGRVLGTFAIYPSEPASPTSEQRSRIEQLTHLASIAIERAQSIDALRRSEERYSRAMDAAGDGHIEWIVATDEFYASAHFLEMCGFPVDTTFRNRADFLARFPSHPDDSDRFIDTINATFASTTDRLELEMRILRHGETRWHHLTGLCSRDATGELLRWNAAITDITDRKLADEALRQSQEGYALAMEASGEGHWDWNIAKNEYHVSPRLLELCRFPRGATFEDREAFLAQLPFHPEDRPRWEEAIAAHFAGETARFDIELRMLPQGETQWIHMTGILSRDASGKPVRWTGSVADITERKRAEEALRRSEAALRLSDERYALAMEAAAEGHFDGNLETGELFVSARLNEIYGFPRRATIVNRAEFLNRIPLHPDDRWLLDDIRKPEWVRPEWQNPTQDFFEYDCRIIPRPGEIRWIHLRGTMIRDAGGRARRRLGVVADITDRKVAEEALCISEERYALAMEASEEGHFDWNVETDEVFASKHLQQMLDLPADAEHRTRGKLMAALIPLHPDDRERVKELTRDVLASAALHHEFEYRLLRGQAQELRWIYSRWKIFRDAHGVAQRIIGVVSDITERKRVEEALREQTERLQLGQAAMRMIIMDWNVTEDLLTWSDDPEWLRGPMPASGRYPLFKDQVHPEDRDSFLATRRRALETLQVETTEFRLLRTDGEVIWVLERKHAFAGANGKPVRMLAAMFDITERKRVEEELRSHQEMLEVAQKAARAAAFEWRVGAGEGGNRWSPDLEALYGIPAGSYDGTYESWKKLVHPEDLPNVRAAIESAQQTGDVDAEYRVLHPGGAIRRVQAKGRMFFDPQGKPARIVGFMLDVTDRHLAEEELQRIERQLRQAQRLEALGTLAGGIAHDFNNLLGAILGYGEMALRSVRAGSRLRRDIENIMIAGERGHALVERILAFSRSGVGEQVALHVEEVVRETLALFAAKLPRDIVIEQRLHAGAAAVMGDPTQVHQVLMNLLTNAVQAMPSGGTLRVSLDRIHLQAPRVVTTGSIAAREYVAMDVADSGSGIPAEVFEKIFDPFFTTKEVGVGTGLGLSLVHGIVTGLGGAIDVATTVGKGSVFKVYLPLAGDVAAPSKPRKRLERKTARTGQGRVMVIDDEAALVRLATETLTELGYSAVGFTSSTKAIAAFLAHPEQFDAVITDESMPGASGSELTRKMRALRPMIPILLVSGYLSTAVIERAREAGASEVLKKPLSARELQMSIERILRPTRGSSTNDIASSKLSGRTAKPRRRVGPPPSQPGPARR